MTRALATVFAGTIALLPGSTPSTSPSGRTGPPQVTAVRADRPLNRAFSDYAEAKHPARHWTGGDGTYSVPTPRGELWMFSDTYLGTVRADGSRSPSTAEGGSTPLVHNSFVRWGATGPRTVTGHAGAGRARAVLPCADRKHWYWSRDGVFDGRDVDVVYARYAHTGPGPLDVTWRGNVLARFRPGRLSQPESVTPLPSSAHVAWGAWLEQDGDRTYVYGTEKAPSGGNYLHLARVAGHDPGGSWQYRTADGSWSSHESRSARLRALGGHPVRTSDELSVVRHGGWYALLTQRQDQPFSAETQLAWSRSPGGPFTHRYTFHTAPEAGRSGTYRSRRVYAYNPHEHPELERRGELVLSYNVNSLAPRDVANRASIYRPRFVRVELSPPGHRG